MAPRNGSIAEKYEILERLRQGGMGAVYPGDRIPDAEELAQALAEVQARFPASTQELGSFFDSLLPVGGEAEPSDALYLRSPESETTRSGPLPLDMAAPLADEPSGMEEVTWARQSPGPIYDPLEPPPAAKSADSSQLLFRLALSTAALLVLFVFARGFWWPEPERRGSAPKWAAAPRSPAAPAPSAATAGPQSEDAAVGKPAAEPTLVEELAGEPSEPAASSASKPEPVIVEAAPAPLMPAKTPRPKPAVSRLEPAPPPERAASPALARRLPQPWEEGPQPTDLLKPGPGVEEPVPLDFPRYTYPAAARGTGLKADVRLALLVNERGQVIDARVRDGAPPDLGFSEAALAVAKRIPFQPATRYDVPGKMWTEVILEFAE